MNRNVAYGILADAEMYPIFVRADDNRSYHTEFRLNGDEGQENCDLFFEWGCVSHVWSVHLLLHGMMIESKFSDMKVFVNYTKAKNFRVQID